jgi:predicted transcriptional regulator
MKGIRIRPEKHGVRATLFDLEADIMEAVWSSDWSWFSVSQVRDQLLQRRDIAYTTVMTTVTRLHKKGLLRRRRDGRRYLYRTKYSRDALAQAMATEVLDSLEAGGQDAAMALLVDRVSRADADELARLEDMIQARRKELKRG